MSGPDNLQVAPSNGLGYVLHFTAEELAMNRNGRLSERQQRAMTRMYGQTQLYSRLMAGLFGLILLAAAALIAAGAWLEIGPLSSLAEGEPTMPYILLGTLAFVAVILAISFARILLRGGDLKKGRVSQVSGPAKLKGSDIGGVAGAASQALGSGGMACELKVGGQKFYIHEDIYHALEQDRSYHVYYVKTGTLPVIVSAEAAA